MDIKTIQKQGSGEKWRVYTTIDGQYCKPEQRVGYCWSEIHRGYLTPSMLKEHECIQKQCKYFQKYEDSPYWKRKAEIKEKKRERKDMKKQQEAKQQGILSTIRALTEEDPDFFAISVEKGTGVNKHQYIVRFVRFAWIDLTYYAKLFRERCGVSVYLREIKTSYDMKLQILQAHHLV